MFQVLDCRSIYIYITLFYIHDFTSARTLRGLHTKNTHRASTYTYIYIHTHRASTYTCTESDGKITPPFLR